MKPSPRGSIASTFVRLLVALVICALLGVVAYLLSNINQHRYRLALVDGQLVVERGLFAPVGFGAFNPGDVAERAAYAPIPVPPGEAVEVGVVFDDRAQVDRALFGRLSSWAQQRLQAPDAPTLELGVQYVKRLEVLPSLSEGQRHELRGMRADAALRQAEGLLRGVGIALRQARGLFEQSLELGTTHAERARRGIADIEHKLSQLDVDSELDAGPRGPAVIVAPAPAPATVTPDVVPAP